MAYRPRRSSSYRKAPARRTYSRSSSARRSTGRRTVRRSTGSSRQQVVKIVVEQVPATQVSRPDGPLQVAAAPPKKSKF